jgi:recombinational DNA repair protein (RecF pathway)
MPAKLDPKIAERVMIAAGLKPLEPYVNSITEWKSKCLDCGKIVYPKYTNIKQGDGGCKPCGLRKLGLTLRLSHKEAAAMMSGAGIEVLETYPGSKRKWKSKCLTCGEVIYPKFTDIKQGDGGCKTCGNKKRAKSLMNSTDEPRTIMILAHLEPLVEYPGSRKPWKCRCLKCGKEVFPKHSDIKQGDGGCKYCGGNYISPESAIAIMRASFLEPLEPYAGTDQKWKCRCLRCGKEVNPMHHSVKRGQGGCRTCANKIRGNANRLTPKQAIQIMLNASLRTLEEYKSSDVPWKCECLKCMNVVFPRYSGIQSGQGGCLTCAGKYIDPVMAKNIMQESGLIPLVDYPGINKPWKSKCKKCKKVVSPWFVSVRNGGGCINCANFGFQPNSPAYLYLITNSELGAHKVGVGNSGKPLKKDRIRSHSNRGWKTYKKWDFSEGSFALDIERDCLLIIRNDLGIVPYLSREQMPQGGWTETFSEELLSLPDAAKLVSGLMKKQSREKI